MKWSYGVTTVWRRPPGGATTPERRNVLLPRTLASLAKAGFDRPRLFVDGADHSDVAVYREMFPGLEITSRWPALRVYGNWVLSLAELYVREPTAERFVIFQDDLVACVNLRQYLEQRPCPEKGYMNLYTFQANEPIIRGKPIGWHEAGLVMPGQPGQTGRGALGLVFSRAAVLDLFIQKNIVERPMEVFKGWRNVDGAVVNALNAADWREFVHNPSLVQHTGTVSTIRDHVHRQAESFRGENWDALELLSKA